MTTGRELAVRVKAEPADEATARLLGMPFTPCLPPREGGMCGCGEDDDGPVLRLPKYMGREGAYQVARLGAGFTEVLPGLEAAVFWPPDSDGNVTAHFRLTRKDEPE